MYVERTCRFDNNTQLWALVNFYFDSGNTMKKGSLFDRGWLTTWDDDVADPCDYCEWEGITCGDNQKITDIRLDSMSLQGTIPAALDSLTDLEHIDFKGTYCMSLHR